MGWFFKLDKPFPNSQANLIDISSLLSRYLVNTKQLNTPQLTTDIKTIINMVEKDDDLDIENLDLDNTEDQVEDDTVLLEDETDVDPAVDVGIKPTEESEEEY